MVVGSLSLVPASAVVADEAPSLTSIIERLETRQHAVVSGTVYYQYDNLNLKITAEEAGSGGPFPWAERNGSTERAVNQLTIAGDEFARRWPSRSTVRVHRNGYTAKYFEKDQRSGDRRKWVELTDPSIVPMSQQVNDTVAFRVLNAGRLRSGRIIDYLRQHVDRINVRTLDPASTASGTSEVELTIEVPASDARQVYGSHKLLEGEKTFQLEIRIIPEFGWAVDRAEYRLDNGTLLRVYRCRDFQEAAPDIWLPREYYFVYNNTNYDAGFNIEQFVIQQTEGINEPVSDDAFHIDLEEGVIVNDWRTSVGGNLTYVLQEQASLTSLESLDQYRVEGDAHYDPAVGDSSKRSILIYGNLVVLLALACILLMRRAVSRGVS